MCPVYQGVLIRGVPLYFMYMQFPYTLFSCVYRPPIDEVGEGVAGRSDDITSVETEARER